MDGPKSVVCSTSLVVEKWVRSIRIPLAGHDFEHAGRSNGLDHLPGAGIRFGASSEGNAQRGDTASEVGEGAIAFDLEGRVGSPDHRIPRPAGRPKKLQ